MKVAFFRPESRAKDLEVFRKSGMDVIHAPLLEIVPDEKEIERFKKAEFDVAVVTSVTAVEILKSYDAIDRLKGKRVIAIGKKTAEKLLQSGIKSELPEKFDSKSVTEEFRGKLRGKVALLRSDRGDPVLLEVGDTEEFRIYRIMEKHGREQEEVVRAVCEGRVDFAVFSSRMMVRSFFSLCKKLGLEKPECTVIAIGPPTRDELKKYGVESIMPEEYTFDGILKLIRSFRP